MSESAEVPVPIKNTEVSQESPPIVAEINAQKPSRLKDLLGILSRQKTKQEDSKPQKTVDDNTPKEVDPEEKQEQVSEVGSAKPQIQETTGEQTPAEEPAETQEITKAKKLIAEITR